MSTDNQGLLAFGDSITNGGGELQWGVALQSWAQWLARALGLPLTNYATDGAVAADVTAIQIPDHRRLNAVEDPRYQLGCLYVGVNDVRRLTWDPVIYEREVAAALAYLNELCDRVMAVSIPLDLGRPRAGDKVVVANAIIQRQATAAGALLLDLSDFGGREHLMFDHVHPSAMGQIAIAERAADLLAGAGMAVKVRPSALAHPEAGLRARAQASLTYAYRAAMRDLRIRLSGLR